MVHNVKYSEWWDAYVKMHIGYHTYRRPLTVTFGVGAAPTTLRNYYSRFSVTTTVTLTKALNIL